MYNGMDRFLSVLFNRFCTCNYFVLRKPVSGKDAWVGEQFQRGATLADEELERLVEWLGRTKGTNDSERQ